MPISDRYRIVFIHIPKCAGTSFWEWLDISACRCNLISVTNAPIYQHLLPKQLKTTYIGEVRWNNYKKITIVRNPYDRVISDYSWFMKYQKIPDLSFDDFLSLREDVVKNNRYAENMFYDHFYPMHFYFEGIEYDEVLRLEELATELPRIQKLFKIEKPFEKANSTDHSDFKLNKAQKERIYKLYKQDFTQFGYKK